MTITLCPHTGLWSPSPCPADCPADQHTEVILAATPAEALCECLNAMRSAFDWALGGEGGHAMDELSKAYEGVTSEGIGI